ncbi:MAG: T9SS type A sorting domain-containing protein [Candidatus Kapabacteria bacterium]|nr:T9SS type A sorting domain-containing protein [Candidatus Kapabacteria bacterium]
MKTSFYKISLIVSLIVLSNIYTFSQEKIQKEPTLKETKQYYESILNETKVENPEQNNFIKRWLWENRLEKPEPIESSSIELYNSYQSKSKDNNIQSQKGWSPLGPINVPASYDNNSGHSIGRINCIAFHPTNKNIMWVGAANGGVWKSVNQGKSWIPLCDELPTLAVSHIAIDPKNPDILYYASGDYDGGNGENLGIFKSIDGGNNWLQTTLVKEKNFAYSALKKIIINPDSTNQLITVGKKGIWKSIDAGASWTFSNLKIVSDIEISSVDSKTLYIAMSSSNNFDNTSIRKSTDFGNTWDSLKTGIPSKWNEISRLEIAISPSDPNCIYAVGANAVSGRYGGFHSFYKSIDAGANWTEVCNYQKYDNIMGWYSGDSTDKAGQGTYDLTLLVDPKDKNKVYLGGTNIWMTSNGGKDWDVVSYWVNCFGKSAHADQHNSAYNPLDSNYYFVNDGGVYRSKEIASGSKEWLNQVDKFYGEPLPNTPKHEFPTKWENVSDGLATTQFYKVALSKNNPGYVTGGAQDNSCYYFNTSDWVNYITNWDGMATLIDHNDPKVIYGVWQNGGLCRSDDGGQIMQNNLTDTLNNKLGENGEWVTPLDMDPNDSKTIYFGLRNLWKTNNKGKTWTKALNFDTTNRNNIHLVKASYSDSKYVSIYKAGQWVQDTAKNWYQKPNELWCLNNNEGNYWQNIKIGLPIDTVALIAIEYDKIYPERMWLLFNNKQTYTTIDAGKNWQLLKKTIPSNINFTSLVHYQNSTLNSLFAGSNHGVYFTNDTMDKWEPYNLNLPNCNINDLAIQEISGKLYAASYGRGIWETSISEVPSSIAEENSDYNFEVYPNPSSGKFEINFKSIYNLNSELELMLLDVMGKKVWGGKIETLNNEIHKSLNLNLESGVYFLKINSSGIDYTKKIFVKN